MPLPNRRLFLASSLPTVAIGSLAALCWGTQAWSSPVIPRMPVLFVGHGSPMNAIQDNEFTRFLRAWGLRFPLPTGIVVVSAHWLTPGSTAVNILAKQPTIHDFGGFPQPLFDMTYPAPGAPDLARATAAMVTRTRVTTTTEWGLDHGAWTVLHHLYPSAQIPVFQLSIDYDNAPNFHHAVGRELAALREKGVLILASGNVVHNLRATDRVPGLSPTSTRPWAQTFDAAVNRALSQRNDVGLLSYWSLAGDTASVAVETPDHYFPLLYALCASDPQTEPGVSVFEGFQAGTISMRCVQFGS